MKINMKTKVMYNKYANAIPVQVGTQEVQQVNDYICILGTVGDNEK